MVTVVDALNIYDVLSSLEMLNETNIAGMTGNDIETDDRSIAQLMLDQIEFANVYLAEQGTPRQGQRCSAGDSLPCSRSSTLLPGS